MLELANDVEYLCKEREQLRAQEHMEIQEAHQKQKENEALAKEIAHFQKQCNATAIEIEQRKKEKLEWEHQVKTKSYEHSLAKEGVEQRKKWIITDPQQMRDVMLPLRMIIQLNLIY
jgi:uncharacterized protein YlxW (UPF0749 family)